VAFYRLQESVLVLLSKGAKGVRHSGTDGPAGQLLFGGGREVSPYRYPPGHPARFAVEQAGDGAGAQPLFAHQRADHPRLIQCGEGTGRSVGPKQQALVFGGRGRRLDEHRDEGLTALAPVCQTFEAVDDFVGALFGGHDADGHLRADLIGKPLRAAGSQGGVGGAQLPEGQQTEAAGGRAHR
jgi:hypothetical protein